ncbi:hypothetical protein HU200_036029 [Digitaria exilis]|uniref:Uncharacterized protein n=1 Tax=Digitaria exilis TaxID=1010633 RepID=A0A835BH18_9POAL|nr:hypothetical protein HU200_036029 [Digitaria exilis]
MHKVKGYNHAAIQPLHREPLYEHRSAGYLRCPPLYCSHNILSHMLAHACAHPDESALFLASFEPTVAPASPRRTAKLEHHSGGFLFRPNPRAAASPAIFPFLSLSLPDVWARSVSAFFKLSPWSERHTPLRRFLACKLELPPPSIAAPPQTPTLSRRRNPSSRGRLRHFELAVEVRVKVRNSPSLYSFSLSRSLAALLRRRHGRAAIARCELPLLLNSRRQPPKRVPRFPLFLPSQTRRVLEPCSAGFPNSGDPSVKRRRARRLSGHRLALFNSSLWIKIERSESDLGQSQNGPFEGDQDQVYEEEPPHYFEEGTREDIIAPLPDGGKSGAAQRLQRGEDDAGALVHGVLLPHRPQTAAAAATVAVRSTSAPFGLLHRLGHDAALVRPAGIRADPAPALWHPSLPECPCLRNCERRRRFAPYALHSICSRGATPASLTRKNMEYHFPTADAVAELARLSERGVQVKGLAKIELLGLFVSDRSIEDGNASWAKTLAVNQPRRRWTIQFR